MELSIESARDLQLPIERHIHKFSSSCQEGLAFLEFILCHIAIERDNAGQYSCIAILIVVQSADLLDDDIDVVSRLHNFDVLGEDAIDIFREEVVVANEGFLLHILFLDHEDRHLIPVLAGAFEKVHVVVLGERLADYVILYLLAFQSRKHDQE